MSGQRIAALSQTVSTGHTPFVRQMMIVGLARPPWRVAPPSISAGDRADRGSQSGRQVALAVSAADPDNDPLTYRFDWGDGAPATVTNGRVASHLFPEGEFRTYTVTVTVDDAEAAKTPQHSNSIFLPLHPTGHPKFEVAQLIEKDGFAVAIAVAAKTDGDMLTYHKLGDDSPETVQKAVSRAMSIPGDLSRLPHHDHCRRCARRP